VTRLTPHVAREYWWALLDNATSLIEDSVRLSDPSPARAQALLVLAYEELGKAVWVHDTFQESWSAASLEPLVVAELGAAARHHLAKFLSAHDFAGVLPRPPIWVAWEELPLAPRNERFDAGTDVRLETQAILDLTAQRANDAKQRGFYVDLLRDGAIRSPRDLEVFDLEVHRGHVAAAIVTLLVVEEFRVKDAREQFEIDRHTSLMARLDLYARDQDYL